MGNGIGKCLAGDISQRRNDVAVYLPDPLDEGLGHSFVYIPSDLLPKPQSKTTLFRTISGAAISANTSTPLSTDPFPYRDSTSLDKSSTFESSSFFSSIPLQPIPRNSVHAVKSGPIMRSSVSGSGPIEHGFLSGPIERSFISGPLDNRFDYVPKPKKRALVRNIRNMISKSFWNLSKELNRNEKDNVIVVASGTNSGNSSSTINSRNLSSELSLCDENEDVEDESFRGQNLQWAQGKAGEDRVHIVISEDHGWVFVGIYDGFNGPDATDFLSSNLYNNVHKELEGLLDGEESSVDHFRVLKGLSVGLRKTEASYLEITDMMLVENPELALMGSCVVCMVMKGDDVYVMNVGDSRAVLARKPDHGKTTKDYVHFLNSSQLTVDHTTSHKGELRRIRNAHLDDPFVVMNDRVKGSLKVTRAFGVGFLKQPKWNNALLEMFRIEYIGTSPYITCSPSLHHHRVGPKDKFLILSSDGLYQYFTNEEAVSEVEMFMAVFPEGDPAQHLVEQVLVRAAKKAGMDFYDLLDIPQGDRRRYHDDVSIIIVSFEGSTWRSSV